MDVACYNKRVMSAPHMEPVADLAVRSAIERRQVSHIIITAVTYNLPIKVVIIKNNSLAQIKWELMVFQGNPEYQRKLFPLVRRACKCGRSRPRAYRRSSYRGRAVRSRPGHAGAVVDQYSAMFPPKIKRDQAIKFEALFRNEPNRIRIDLTAASDTVRQIV
jgi:pyruvate dehydrogenase (quinone)/pyruvate oxidase